MYASIKLEHEMFPLYSVANDSREIEALSKINIFIGPNNSGKSRFLRSLFIQPKIKFKVPGLDLKMVADAVEKFLQRLKNNLGNNIDLSSFYIKQQFLQIPEYFGEGYSCSETFNEIKRLVRIKNEDYKGYTMIQGISVPTFVHQIKDAASYCLNEFNDIKLDQFDSHVAARNNVYIPILRGLRGTNYLDNQTKLNHFDSYKHRTQNDYFASNWSEERKQIYTGLSLYEDVRKHLLGVSSERQKIKEFESFLSETFFEGEDISIVPHIDDNVVYVKIGDDDDRPIYNLGEGIQALIILTYPLFLNQGKNLNFFFEEPDLYLHPGFQRVFMETLNHPRFSSFQYFFTTHSNHFLDMTLDFQSTSIYAFQRKNKEDFSIVNIKSADKDILQSLGVRNSSVFLTNCTIWVEGITDRIYLRKYLEVFMKDKDRKFKEDLHFSFVEYGGNNITHWSFLESEDENFANINVEVLCGKLFLVTDSDGAKVNGSKKSKKRLRQEKLMEKLGEDNFYCLECREIENSLKPEVIKETVLNFEKPEEEEEHDFSELEKVTYTSKPLGTFIDKNITGLKRKYASDSGTVANKVQFAKYATTHVNSEADITEEAKKLAEKLYDFIAKNN